MKEADIRPADLFNRYLELSEADARSLLAKRDRFVHGPCPACGGPGAPGLEKGGYDYEVCSACGTLFLNPRPDAGLMDEFYATAESVRFWATDFYRATAEARREKMIRPRAELAAELADHHGLGRDARLVDVGSGYGVFLEEARAGGRFASVRGIEPAAELAQVCRDKGFDVVETTAEALPPGQVQADFVAAFEVLEHVTSPVDFLAGVAKILAPGGVALLTTLTVDGFDIQTLWERSKAVYAPHHVNLISVEGYRQLFRRVGLEVESITTPGKLDLDIVANTAREQPDLALPRFVRTLIAAPEQTRLAFQAFLQDNLLSSHLRMVVRRAHD